MIKIICFHNLRYFRLDSCKLSIKFQDLVWENTKLNIFSAYSFKVGRAFSFNSGFDKRLRIIPKKIKVLNFYI